MNVEPNYGSHCTPPRCGSAGGLGAASAENYTGEVPHILPLNSRDAALRFHGCSGQRATGVLHAQRQSPVKFYNCLSRTAGLPCSRFVAFEYGAASWVQYRLLRASGRCRALPLVAVNLPILGSRFWCRSASHGRGKRPNGFRTSPVAVFAPVTAGSLAVLNLGHVKSSQSFPLCATNTRHAGACCSNRTRGTGRGGLDGGGRSSDQRRP